MRFRNHFFSALHDLSPIAAMQSGFGARPPARPFDQGPHWSMESDALRLTPGVGRVRKGHLGARRRHPVWHPQTGRLPHGAMALGESPRAQRQRVPALAGRTPASAAARRRSFGRAIAAAPRGSSPLHSHVTSRDTTYQQNGAYSRTDAPTALCRAARAVSFPD